MKIPSTILTMLAGIVLTLVSLWYGQNHGLLPVAASDEATLVDGLFNTMMTVSTGLFLLVEGVLVISIIKFRRRPGDTSDGPPVHGNIPLEIVWTAIPAVIVFIIGVYSFEVYAQMGGFGPDAQNNPGMNPGGVEVAMLPGEQIPGLLDGSQMPSAHGSHSHQVALGVGASPNVKDNDPDLVVDVKGIQFAWIFTYPESGVTSAELHLPVGKDVKLNITAQDVLHALWLPEFRLKQDAIPGQESELRFIPRRPGEYPVICAELCGAYHGGMVTKLYVQSADDYDAWMQQQIAAQDNGEAIATILEPRTPQDLFQPYVSQLGFEDATHYLMQFQPSETASGLDPEHLHQMTEALSPAV